MATNKERIDYAIAVLAFKALHDPHSPPNVKIKLKEDRRTLRNQSANVGPKIECHDRAKTFQTGAALVFNDLPKKTRENLLDRATAINFE